MWNSSYSATEQAAMTSLVFNNITNDTNLTSSLLDDHVTQVAANKDTLYLTRLIVQKICVPLVVLVGVIGNSLSIVVLTRKCMKSSTNSYLTALAVFDLLYLVFSFTLSLQHHHYFRYSSPYVHWFPFARVFTDMFANVSVILTVTFTVERYVGVCHPMKGRILCTPQRAKIITAIVSTVAILCTAPELWEMEVVWEPVPNTNKTVPVARYTEFARQASYEVGYYWFLVVMFTFLPLILLCVFNGILISSVIKAARLRKQMTLLRPASGSSTTSRGGASQPKEQQKITKMLITVVLVFIVCQLPGASLLLYGTFNSLADVQVPKETENNMRIAGNVANLLIQINASINFILYSAISTKFRRVFYRTLCGGRGSMCQFQGRRHSTFSRSDGVQMSSFYEGKITSFSSYTFKVRGSQRSYRSERSSPGHTDQREVTSRKHWRRHRGQNGCLAPNANERSTRLWDLSPTRSGTSPTRSDTSPTQITTSLTVNGRDPKRRGGHLGDTYEPNGSYCDRDIYCGNGLYERKPNAMGRTSWGGRSNRDSQYLWASDNIRR